MTLNILDNNGRIVLSLDAIEDQLLFAFGHNQDRAQARASIIADLVYCCLDNFPRPQNLTEEFINRVKDEVNGKLWETISK
jgi:ADP-ribosylglycohydrolase